jgi:predicted PolB exonuclease-like 3'-5' exonuclease
MNTPTPPPPMPEKNLSELMSANAIVLDIETVANPVALTSCMAVFEGKANTKDPLKIAAQIKEKEEKFISQAALSPSYGKIVVLCLKNASIEHVFQDEDEKVLISKAWDVLKDWQELVGFNSKQFDLPFLIRRSWFHSVKPTVKYDLFPFRTVNHYDLRLLLNHGQKMAPGRLSDFIKLKFGEDIEGKGSEVAELYAAGKIDEIARHCQSDVFWTFKLFQSMRGYYF